MATYPLLTGAVEDALRAPSVHNTQPWRWRIGPDAVELHADWDRHLSATDPDRRDLVLSCGAALHHLQVALAARGFAVDVRRLPAPEDSGHLATVVLRPQHDATAADPVAAALLPSIAARRTDRRRMSHRPVAAEHLRSLVDQAARAGAVLVPVADPDARRRLVAVLIEAGRHQHAEPGYATELRTWTHRFPAGHDGVPAASVAPAPIGAMEPSPLRRFGPGRLAQPPQEPERGPGDDAAELMVIITRGDDVLDRLRAGEATSAALLAATRIGLVTTPLSQAVEIAASREHVQRDVLRAPEHPQLVIRVGWPAPGAAELPATPRRALGSMLLA